MQIRRHLPKFVQVVDRTAVSNRYSERSGGRRCIGRIRVSEQDTCHRVPFHIRIGHLAHARLDHRRTDKLLPGSQYAAIAKMIRIVRITEHANTQLGCICLNNTFGFEA